jgi:hypothetical protein
MSEAFLWNLIPVVGGPPDGHRFVPTNHSAIFTEDFANAAALGAFLTKVGNDEKLYNAYHSWRANPAEISAEFKKNFPPQSQKENRNDLCKFVKVWHHAGWFAETGEPKKAKPFDPFCEVSRPGGI